jgi:hypothetical protein
MNKKIKRPASVWITQVLCLFNSIPALLGASVPLARIVANGLFLRPSLDLLRFILLVVGAGIAPLIAFWGLQKRKVYGKWLGVLVLLFLVAKQFMTKEGLAPYIYLLTKDRSVYDSIFIHQASEMTIIAQSVLYIIIQALLISLMLRLAIGKPANQFFHDNHAVPIDISSSSG